MRLGVAPLPEVHGRDDGGPQPAGDTPQQGCTPDAAVLRGRHNGRLVAKGAAVLPTDGLDITAQELIKQLITSLMLCAPPLVRAQLSEALSLISSHDFPAKWPVRCWRRRATIVT